MIVVSVYVGQIDGQIDCVTPATHESVLAKSYPTRYSNQILGSSPRTTEITTQHDERVMPERSFVVNIAHSGNFRVFNLNPWDEITRQKSIKLVLFARGVDLGRRVSERGRARERECARERERERGRYGVGRNCQSESGKTWGAHSVGPTCGGPTLHGPIASSRLCAQQNHDLLSQRPGTRSPNLFQQKLAPCRSPPPSPRPGNPCII